MHVTIYKRNRRSKLGGASIRRGAFIGDNTVYITNSQFCLTSTNFFVILRLLNLEFTSHPVEGSIDNWKPVSCQSETTTTNFMLLSFHKNISGIDDQTVTFSYVASKHFTEDL